MKLVYHGGMCCGIKTIFSLGDSPSSTVTEIYEVPETNYDKHYDFWKGATRAACLEDARFFAPAAPYELASERIQRYIVYCEKRRPKGIIEVVLADNAGDYDYETYPEDEENQYLQWKDFLIELGFKELNSCENSNSDNNVYVFHRNCGEVPRCKWKEKVKK